MGASMTKRPPTSPSLRLSIGLPVRNAEATIDRAIESVLSQTFDALELVISDNASTDGTGARCRAWARRDPRVRYCPLPSNRGIIANFNRSFRLSEGEYFRFIGADDWLEPTYAERCIEALDARPEVIGVTTYQAHWQADGTREYAEYEGPRVDSPRATERYAACLHLLRQSYLYYDPCYSMYRRSAMAKTRILRDVQANDTVLAVELSLVGPYAHVAACLAHRGKPNTDYADVVELMKIPGGGPLEDSPEERLRLLLGLLDEAKIPMTERLDCYAAALRYYGFLNQLFRVRPARHEAGRLLRAHGLPLERLRSRLRRTEDA
jgi:glycosyltransferase involved in cell wall biosynthesis